MKVLVIHNLYRSDTVGGEDLVFRQELQALEQKLGKESVFSYSVSNDHLSKIKIVFGIWYSFRHARAVSKLVRDHQVDIVHIHNFFPMLTPAVWVAAKRARAKIVMTLHNYRIGCISGILYRNSVGACELCVGKTLPISGIRYGCYRNSRIQSALAQVAFSFYRVAGFFKLIDRFFVLTQFQKAKILELGVDSKKVLIKPNFVETPEVQAHLKSGFVYVGRMEAMKGVHLLLETWLKLDSSKVLTLIGSGEDYNELKARYSRSNIIFLGALRQSEVVKKIAEAKYLLQTSLMYETFGLTVVEALALGTPVIGFEIGTRPELIQHKKNGFLTKPSALKEAVLLADEFAEYEELVNGAKASSKQFKKDHILNLQIEAYKTLID